jgi:dihydropteroate synthase
LKAGASIVNDITALRGDPQMASVVRDHRAGVCLMHMQGTPETMQLEPTYTDVVGEVVSFLAERVRFAVDAGIAFDNIAIDPGIGFGKTVEHNYELLRNIDRFQAIARPLLLGVSRKGFIGIATGKPRDERMVGSVALACYGWAKGSAAIWRVHDVAPSVEAAKMLGAVGQSNARVVSD